jgi:hypothetical protein
MLASLITRHPQNRPTPISLPSHPFFSSLPISTLNFLDRSNFAAKSREEKISFMKGLTSVLDRFSEGLRVRKVLPSLLEEVGIRTSLGGFRLHRFPFSDERPPSFALYPAQCVRYLDHCHSPAICFLGPAQPQTPVHYQGTSAKHAHPPG